MTERQIVTDAEAQPVREWIDAGNEVVNQMLVWALLDTREALIEALERVTADSRYVHERAPFAVCGSLTKAESLLYQLKGKSA